ncbi:MAG: hypothetical protein IJH50_01325 [Kiritimatiellae bacterium]|nr:hypothetical protein [Kiritimatiellia bacterium]
MAELKASCKRLEVKSRAIAQETEKVKSTVPFTYKALLDDEKLVAERQGQLNAQIAALEECVNEYKELWNNGK